MDSLCSKNRRRRVGGAGIDFFHVFFLLIFFFACRRLLRSFISFLVLRFILCYAFHFYECECVCGSVCQAVCVFVCVGAAWSAQLYSVPLPTFYVFLFICAALQFQKVFACCPRLRWRALA